MQLQRCIFKRKKDTAWEPGVAKVKAFDCNDVDVILDANLKKVGKRVWDYRLTSGNGFAPHVYLEV